MNVVIGIANEYMEAINLSNFSEIGPYIEDESQLGCIVSVSENLEGHMRERRESIVTCSLNQRIGIHVLIKIIT